MKKYAMILVLLTITLAACGKNERDIYADAGEVITDTAFNELYKQLPDREDKDNENEVAPANLEFDEDKIVFENCSLLYGFLGAEDYDKFQRSTEAFTENIGIRDKVTTVTVIETSLTIIATTELRFAFTLDNGETYWIISNPTEDDVRNFDYYAENDVEFSNMIFSTSNPG